MLHRTRSIFHLEGEEGEEGEGESALNNGGFLAIKAGDSLVGLQILIQQKNEQGFNVPADSSDMICKKPAIISAEFLKSCFWCSKELNFHKEVYMYRGDQGFCSMECRYKQILQDERRELSVIKIVQHRLPNHHHHHPHHHVGSKIVKSNGLTKIVVAS